MDHAVAEALQRVLLPAGLPDLDDWALATLYEPAGEAVLVGGDFYDWFTLPDGRVVFFVGDVSGKGPLAGALGLSIRKALKGITWVTGDAAASLPVLEQALAAEFGDAFATLCLLELTPGSGAVRLLLAGHPAPWWCRGGRFEEVTAPPNCLLGPGLGSSWEYAEVRMDPGDSLVLFTDGLTEARLPGGDLYGQAAWPAFLEALPRGLSGVEVLVRADADLRRSAVGLSDDVVIGVLTYAAVRERGGSATESLTIRLASSPVAVGQGRRFVQEACARWRSCPADLDDAALLTSELLTAAVLACPCDAVRDGIELTVTRTLGRLVVAVRSPGAGRTDPPPPGRGVHLAELLGAVVRSSAVGTQVVVEATLSQARRASTRR